MSTHSQLDRANQLFADGCYDQAAAGYLAVIARTPRHADAWYNLGVTRTIQKRFPEAVEAYRKALRYRSDSPNANNNLATLLQAYGAGDPAEER